ncbi:MULTISPECIES: hypothetical protein [unclassified Mesorhizobium]|uniref:hypothetical protein n=1 Tax=unclassified Mesorhizobium TaxID=325217 RepID=UPI00331ADC71
MNPSVQQSGQVRPTMGGSPSRAVVMRAACSSRRPGRPLVLPDRCEPSPCGVRARRGQHVAAVATARKLSVVICHLLRRARVTRRLDPPCMPRSLRDVELKAGSKAVRGQKGAHAYNIKSHREEERRWVEQAEGAYARLVAGWNPRGPKRVGTDAANEARR